MRKLWEGLDKDVNEEQDVDAEVPEEEILDNVHEASVEDSVGEEKPESVESPEVK